MNDATPATKSAEYGLMSSSVFAEPVFHLTDLILMRYLMLLLFRSHGGMLGKRDTMKENTGLRSECQRRRGFCTSYDRAPVTYLSAEESVCRKQSLDYSRNLRKQSKRAWHFSLLQVKMTLVMTMLGIICTWMT